MNPSDTTDANNNTSVGALNLQNITATAKSNTAMGTHVLENTLSGSENSGVGFEALVGNVHGNYNTATGYQTLKANTSGGHNTAIGHGALKTNVSGSQNTAVGAAADVETASITNSTAIGAGARVEHSNTVVLGNQYVTDVFTSGHITSNGNITGLAKFFTIDHPLTDMKEQGYSLKHASVEAPRLDLMYRDTITLIDGSAHINLDETFHMTEGTFASLCANPSIFVTNESDWDPVRGSMESGGNVLHIMCKNEQSCARVSFLVIAERKDEAILNTEMTDDAGRFVPERKFPLMK
jgi:hypothetical protein